jgi:hypothetical protein
VETEPEASSAGESRPGGRAPEPQRRLRWWQHPRVEAARAWLSANFLPGGPEFNTPGWNVAVLSGVGSIIVLLLRLFVPTPVGMADQGDGQRLFCPLGVANPHPFDYAKLWQYIYPSWQPHQWYGEACGVSGSGEQYFSSQSIFLWPAKLLTPLLGWGNGLDTRAVGIVCVIAFGVLLTLFIALLPGRPLFRALFAAMITLIMADSVFADFFISPYSETACFLGVFAILISLMYLWRRDHVSLLGIGAVMLSTAFTIAAKTQMASVLPVVAVALLWFPIRTPHDRRARRDRSVRETEPARRRLVRGLATRVPAFVAVVALVAFTGVFLANQPKRFNELNLYNAIFVEMLPHSPTPKADLAWFGLDKTFASSSGAAIISQNSAALNPHFGEFQRNVTVSKVAVFYLSHPARLISLADRGLEAMAQPQLNYLGSYMADSGKPPSTKDQRVPVISSISTVFRVVPLLLVVIQLVTLFLAIAVATRRRLGAPAVALARAVIVAVFALWLQFWAVMLSEGQSEIYKHMIIATFISSLCLPFIVGLVLLLRQNSLQQQLRGTIPVTSPPRASRSNEVSEARVDIEERTDRRGRPLGGAAVAIGVDSQAHSSIDAGIVE